MKFFSDFVSNIYMLLVAFLPVFGYIIYRWFCEKSVTNLPPGPREWGTTWKILQASFNRSLVWLVTDWAKKYGSITYVSCLGQRLVFLNSAEVTRKLLGSEDYKHLLADRIQPEACQVADFNGKDLIFTNYDAIMRKKRRIFHNAIGLYGDGVSKYENAVWGVMKRMFAEIDMKQGKDLEITKLLSHSLKNIICFLAIGDHVNEHVFDVLEEYDLAFNNLTATDMDFVLKYLPFIARISGKVKKVVDRFKFVKKQAEEIFYFCPKRTFKVGQLRGIVDHLLELQKQPSFEWMDKDPQHVTAFLGSFFISAHLTTRAALHGAFLCLLNHPRATRKIQQEIDAVIGAEQPHIEHRRRMSFTEAAVLETLRLVSQLALPVPRKASEDITFEGMIIPKNSMVTINVWYAHHDEKIWEDPWNFKPERFLDNEGNLLPVDHPVRKNLIPFGMGVRACPGETFARSRVFLVITSILQRYDLHPPANENLAPLDFKTDVEESKTSVRQVAPFKCRLTLR